MKSDFLSFVFGTKNIQYRILNELNWIDPNLNIFKQQNEIENEYSLFQVKFSLETPELISTTFY